MENCLSLRLRYVSINGQLRNMALIVKMRGSEHSIDMWEYKITTKDAVMGEPLRGYRGLTSGIPGPWSAENTLPSRPAKSKEVSASVPKSPRSKSARGRKKGP
jgi:hypothetical protein